MPIHVGDVGQSVLNACRIPKIDGEIFELFGPEAYYLTDLLKLSMQATNYAAMEGEPVIVRKVPMALLNRYAQFFERVSMMGEPPLDRILMDLYHSTEVPRGLPGVRELEVTRQNKLEEFLVEILRPFRPSDYYYETADEIEFPKPVDLEQYLSSDAGPPYKKVSEASKLLM